jgi:hypothetical protein
MEYKEDFPVGSRVLIKDREFLEEFKRSWKYHHPLDGSQLQYAGMTARVKNVSFYHGGDVLYGLKRIPGTWHEACLRAADNSKASFWESIRRRLWPPT